MDFRLYKKERLCSATAIDQLFSRGSSSNSTLSYPLRAVWRNNPRRRSDSPAAFVIIVPKRRLHHAVDRVTMRRRIREAYRLNRQCLDLPQGTRLDVAFVYAADKLRPYHRVEEAMRTLMRRISDSFAHTEQPTTPADGEPAQTPQ